MSKRKRIPYFREVLSFNLVTGEVLNLHQSAIRIGQTTPMSKESFLKSTLSAGLFGGSGNVNVSTPESSAQSVIPRPEDFVNIPYRFISATTVGAGSWKATDFSRDGVLKASLDLFSGTPIFSDHVQTSDNWAGIVTDPYWQEEFTDDAGVRVPGGISGNASLDSKTQFNLIRGVLAGAIGSNSVTVRFDWEPSHSYNNMDEFQNMMGEMHKDGTMVRRVVKQVNQYFETSMLFAGADPFSKRLDDKGQPIKIDRSAVYYSKANSTEKTAYESEKRFVVIAENDKELLSLAKANRTEAPKTSTQSHSNSNMKNFLLAFLAAFGTKLNLSFSAVPDNGELTPEQTTELISAMGKLGLSAPAPTAEEVAALDKDKKIVAFATGLKFVNDKGETSAFDPAVATGEHVIIPMAVHTANVAAFGKLKTDKEALEPVAAMGATFVQAKRDETVRLYKLAAGDKFDAAVETLIKEAKPEALDGLLKQYGGEVGVKFTATCTKCNSSDSVEMRSSFAGNHDDKGEEVEFVEVDYQRQYANRPLFGRR